MFGWFTARFLEYKYSYRIYREWMLTPSTAYLVCATPRSGSTLLCETLRATGVAGHPLEHFEVLRHSGQPRQPREYFDGVGEPATVRRRLAALDAPRPDPEPSPEWWTRIPRQGATTNDVWGGKLMWGHVDDLLVRARELDASAPTPTCARRCARSWASTCASST
jgi:trehalose 2-sulfotransferase